MSEPKRCHACGEILGPRYYASAPVVRRFIDPGNGEPPVPVVERADLCLRCHADIFSRVAR